MSQRPNYLRVFLTFARNSLVRDMLFPANFIIESISSFGWVMMNVDTLGSGVFLVDRRDFLRL